MTVLLYMPFFILGKLSKKIFLLNYNEQRERDYFFLSKNPRAIQNVYHTLLQKWELYTNPTGNYIRGIKSATLSAINTFETKELQLALSQAFKVLKLIY